MIRRRAGGGMAMRAGNLARYHDLDVGDERVAGHPGQVGVGEAQNPAEMDPLDAKIMHHLYSEKVGRIRRGGGGDSKKDTSVDLISRELGNRNDDVEVTIEHLED